jgi:hypothetical protein
VNVSSKQLRVMSDAMVRRQANDMRRSVDERTRTPGERDAPLARLSALRDIVVEQCEALGSSGRYLASDIDFTAGLLRVELERGARYEETRAEALLLSAAALGALWFIDSRLLEPRDFFSPPAGAANQPRGLLSVDLGTRFERASEVAKSRSMALMQALRHAMDDACSSASLRLLSEKVFGSDRQDALTQFMSAEKQLLQRGEIVAPQLQALCVAGDLAFGLGRCVRLLAHFGSASAGDDRLKLLTSIVNGMADEA